MKRLFFIASMACFSSFGFTQDLQQSEVPSVVVNNFQKAFPKALEVEWEKEAGNYKVDFDIAPDKDHEVWYDSTGKIIKHKEEIAKSSLPKAVQAKIATDFKGYRVEDVKKITVGTKITYSFELKSTTAEWKVTTDETGKVLTKIAD